jgi:hypothetical protein
MSNSQSLPTDSRTNPDSARQQTRPASIETHLNMPFGQFSVPYTFSRLLPTPTAATADPRHLNHGVPNPSVVDRAAAGLHRFARVLPGVTPTSLHPDFAAAATPTGLHPAVVNPYADPSFYQQTFHPHGVPPVQTPAVTPAAAPSARPLGNPTPEPAAAAAFTFDHPAVDPNTVPFDPYANQAYYPSMHAPYHPMQYYPPHQYHHGVPMRHFNPQLNPYAQSFTPASAPAPVAPAPVAPAPVAPAPTAPAATPETTDLSHDVTPDESPLFPEASLRGEHRKTPRTDFEIAQSNIRLHRSQRGQPGSKEYIYNHGTITKTNVIKPRLDFVDIDAIADPSKFDPKLASSVSDYSSSITRMVNHIKQYDLLSPIMVPVDIDLTKTTVSDEKYNLLIDHPRFDRDQIALWTVFFKTHPTDRTDSDSDNLLQDYFLNCLGGRLLFEVQEEFYELPEDEQGAATLIYLALSKLHAHSDALISALQGSITNFKITQIEYEDVSLAATWLRAIIKTLKVTDDIPSRAAGSILTGMATSSCEQFNTYIAVLENVNFKPSGLSRSNSRLSTRRAENVYSVIESCTDKYRDLVHRGHWPKLKPPKGSSADSALVASSAPSSTPNDSSYAKKLLESISPDDLLALVLNGGVRKCFNPLCNSEKHLLRDCPGPFPPNWDHTGGNRSRSNSRGRPLHRSKSSDRNGKNQPREQTPGLRKKPSVSFDKSKSSKSKQHRVYNASVEADESEYEQDEDNDAESTSSEYNSDMHSAFLLRQQLKD